VGRTHPPVQTTNHPPLLIVPVPLLRVQKAKRTKKNTGIRNIERKTAHPKTAQSKRKRRRKNTKRRRNTKDGECKRKRMHINQDWSKLLSKTMIKRLMFKKK
jgi:hypothetical protein